MIIIVYTVLLRLCVWNAPASETTLRSLDLHTDRILTNTAIIAFCNPMVELCKVRIR